MSITRGKCGKKNLVLGDFPGSPVVETLCFHWGSADSIPVWGTGILHATQHYKTKQNRARLQLEQKLTRD